MARRVKFISRAFESHDFTFRERKGYADSGSHIPRTGGMITIQVNGESKDVPENLTLIALLDWLKLPADRVAVERNLEIVGRNQWSGTVIQQGDRLEVVHFVGGGNIQ